MRASLEVRRHPPRPAVSGSPVLLGRSVRFTDVSDRLPLFPLNTVLFPGIVMPLHIFEDRYRSLVRDLIALPPESDREFGVVAIKVGYEVGERGVHTIQRTGCAALVTEVTANPDGTFEILVVGRRRFHVENLDPSQEYLRADVEWLSDTPGGDSPADAATRRGDRPQPVRGLPRLGRSPARRRHPRRRRTRRPGRPLVHPRRRPGAQPRPAPDHARSSRCHQSAAARHRR